MADSNTLVNASCVDKFFGVSSVKQELVSLAYRHVAGFNRRASANAEEMNGESGNQL